ncbi:MAG: class I SAM-dependent methyltransferase [Alkaliphilus sp.]
MSIVEKFYNENANYEWERLNHHKVEFDITKRYLNDYIMSSSKILDVGGGPGRYSIFLATQGHEVTLLDLSNENIKLGIEKAKEANVEIKEFIHGNALNLSEDVEGVFDVVLCMGPLYHFTEEADRVKVIQECMKKLKLGGLLFVAFISAYAPIIDYIKNCAEDIIGEKENLLKYLDDGRNVVNEERPGFTTAYFINPSEIESFMSQFELEKKVITGVEGLFAQSEEKTNSLSKEAYKEWLDLIYKTSTNPITWASCEHFLYVGRKTNVGS